MKKPICLLISCFVFILPFHGLSFASSLNVNEFQLGTYHPFTLKDRQVFINKLDSKFEKLEKSFQWKNGNELLAQHTHQMNSVKRFLQFHYELTQNYSDIKFFSSKSVPFFVSYQRPLISTQEERNFYIDHDLISLIVKMVESSDFDILLSHGGVELLKLLVIGEMEYSLEVENITEPTTQQQLLARYHAVLKMKQYYDDIKKENKETYVSLKNFLPLLKEAGGRLNLIVRLIQSFENFDMASKEDHTSILDWMLEMLELESSLENMTYLSWMIQRMEVLYESEMTIKDLYWKNSLEEFYQSLFEWVYLGDSKLDFVNNQTVELILASIPPMTVYLEDKKISDLAKVMIPLLNPKNYGQKEPLGNAAAFRITEQTLDVIYQLLFQMKDGKMRQTLLREILQELSEEKESFFIKNLKGIERKLPLATTLAYYVTDRMIHERNEDEFTGKVLSDSFLNDLKVRLDKLEMLAEDEQKYVFLRFEYLYLLRANLNEHQKKKIITLSQKVISYYLKEPIRYRIFLRRSLSFIALIGASVNDDLQKEALFLELLKFYDQILKGDSTRVKYNKTDFAFEVSGLAFLFRSYHKGPLDIKIDRPGERLNAFIKDLKEEAEQEGYYFEKDVYPRGEEPFVDPDKERWKEQRDKAKQEINLAIKERSKSIGTLINKNVVGSAENISDSEKAGLIKINEKALIPIRVYLDDLKGDEPYYLELLLRISRWHISESFARQWSKYEYFLSFVFIVLNPHLSDEFKQDVLLNSFFKNPEFYQLAASFFEKRFELLSFVQQEFESFDAAFHDEVLEVLKESLKKSFKKQISSYSEKSFYHVQGSLIKAVSYFVQFGSIDKQMQLFNTLFKESLVNGTEYYFFKEKFLENLDRRYSQELLDHIHSKILKHYKNSKFIRNRDKKEKRKEETFRLLLLSARYADDNRQILKIAREHLDSANFYDIENIAKLIIELKDEDAIRHELQAFRKLHNEDNNDVYGHAISRIELYVFQHYFDQVKKEIPVIDAQKTSDIEAGKANIFSSQFHLSA